MEKDYISPEAFAALPQSEQDRIMRQYIMEMSVGERRTIKKLIEVEKGW